MFKASNCRVLEACFLLLILGLVLTVQTSHFTPVVKAKAATRRGADSITLKWSMRNRFGVKGDNGLVNYHWNGETQRYDDSYVNPKVWTVDFDGCEGFPPQSVFRWEIDGQPLSETRCSFARDFPALQTYLIKLTATAPDGQTNTAEASVTVRDLFIVSIGDSFASGEGKTRTSPGTS